MLELLHALRLERAHLLGTSLGAWVAAEAAVKDGARLATLVLSNPVGLHVKGLAMPDHFLLPPEAETRLAFHDPRLVEVALAAPVSDEEADRQLKNRFAYARAAWAPRLHDPHLEKWLPRLRTPTLVLNGAEDRLVPPAIGARYAERLPDARQVLIHAAGHLPEIEQPDAFCAAVEAFIAERAA